MRVLVFGARGLIGSPTCEKLLADGAEVGAFDRRPPPEDLPFPVFQGDISNRDDVTRAFEAFKPDAVLQLAACLQKQAEYDPELGVSVNVDGAMNVLAAAAGAGVRRFVFANSIAAYGERCDTMHEDDPPAASVSIYGIQKRLGEMLGQRFAEQHGFGFLALRYSAIFGPGEVKEAGMSLARHLLLKTADGNPVDIDFVSGEETAHLTYVADAVEATVRALYVDSPSHFVYNVGGPVENYVSLRRFHEQIREIVPAAGEATFSGRARSAGPVDISRMVDDLGYQPRFLTIDALRDLFGDKSD